ncbi:MAG: hypothetical protein ACRC6B_12415, partial [Fusobacteriaceae bacterium]
MLTKINDIRDGDSFIHYKEKFYLQDGTDVLDDERMKKLFVDYKMLNKVVELFTSFCPDLEISVPKGKKSSDKVELLRAVVTAIRWSSLNSQIYDMLETKGDVFFYIYFDQIKTKGNKKKGNWVIPKLRQLEAENMQQIVLDEANNPKYYIYKHKLFDETIDYKTGYITKENEREETIIFEKGKCHKVVDRKDSEGKLVLDEEGKIVVDKTTIKNDDSLSHIIPIIHVSSIKRQEEKFSIIPAEKYVDLCLLIDQIHSDIRATNRNLGFPKTMLLDCGIVDGDGRIGGYIEVKSNKSVDDFDSKQGQIIDRQIKNGLDSVFSELSHAIDTLYDVVGITNPTLMNRVSSSDSSKMYNQVNMRMEQKIEGYIDNIIEGFKPFFEVALTMNSMYDTKEDFGYSFAKPQSIIKNSAYDELLIKQIELNTGYKTLHDILKEKNYTDDEIEAHF